MYDITVTHTIRSKAVLGADAIRTIVTHVLKKEKVRSGGMSVHIVGSRRMRSLNAVYRGVDRSTDVLSFGMGVDSWNDGGEIGDIFMCQEYIQQQSKRFNVSIREEATRMLVHGVLHLLGYDHEHTDESAKMFARQEQYVQQLTT